MSRTKKLVAVGVAALGLAAATVSPALANRHQEAPTSGHHVSLGTENRHETVLPLENRHET